MGEQPGNEREPARRGGPDEGLYVLVVVLFVLLVVVAVSWPRVNASAFPPHINHNL